MEVPKRLTKQKCLKINHLTFSLTLPADDEIIDIFSTDVENPCSLSLGNFTITNYNPKTYSISVEVKNDSITNEGACGAQITPSGSIDWLFATKSGQRFFTDKDRLYYLICARHITYIESRKIPNYMVNNYRRVQMKIISYNNSGITDGQELNSFVPGLNAKIQITSTYKYKNARVSWCYVVNELDRNNTVYDIQCSEKNSNSLQFVQTKENPVMFESSSFKIIQFPNYEMIAYVCYIEFCKMEDDFYCKNTNCVPFGTYLRTYMKVGTMLMLSSGSELETLASGADEIMPLGLLMLLVIMNLL